MKTRIKKGLGSLQILVIFCVVLVLSTIASSDEVYRFARMWPTLQQPWYFHLPWGVAVDRDGYVYVADRVNNRIQKFTPAGKFVAKWGGYGSANGKFRGFVGIAVDSSGFVYVADTGNSHIQKFTADGNFVTKWGSQGSGKGEFKAPFGIAVDSSGLRANLWPNGEAKAAETGNFKVLLV
jgi:DNA-binding beta-propeller fold protein YncE